MNSPSFTSSVEQVRNASGRSASHQQHQQPVKERHDATTAAHQPGTAMPRTSIRPRASLAATIRNLPVRRPFIPIRLESDALFLGRVLGQRDGTLDEHALVRRVAVVVEFAFKVARDACAVFHDRAWVLERFADVAVAVSYAAVVERLRGVSRGLSEEKGLTCRPNKHWSSRLSLGLHSSMSSCCGSSTLRTPAECQPSPDGTRKTHISAAQSAKSRDAQSHSFPFPLGPSRST